MSWTLQIGLILLCIGIIQGKKVCESSYCSNTKLVTSVDKFNYSWTIDGMLNYISRTPCDYLSKRGFGKTQTGMKFNLIENITGNWSASVHREKRCGLEMKLVYETWNEPDDILGQLIVKQDNNLLMKLSEPLITTYTFPKSTNSSNSPSPLDGYRSPNKFITQLVWKIPPNEFQTILEGFTGGRRDKINFIFQLDIFRDSFTTQFQENCCID